MITNVPSFKGFHITQKGRESLQNKPTWFIKDELLPTAEAAKKDTKNTLSIEDDGRIYIETPKDGKFTVNNPADGKVHGEYFTCNVRTPNGEVKRISVPFESEAKAKSFQNNNFGGGAYIPQMNLDLYKAIAAADTYKQSLIDSL